MVRLPQRFGTMSETQSSDAKPETPEQKPPEGGKDGKGQPEERGTKPFRPSKTVIVIGVLVLLAILIGGLLYWLHARQFISTDDAYTTGHVHQISARVAGIVNEVRVDDNQEVKEGDVLVTLDPRDFESALSRAKANFAQAQAQIGSQGSSVTQTRAGVAVAEAKVEQARAGVTQSAAQLQKARLDYERVAGLFTKDMKAVSKADVDAATAAFESARSESEGARANLAAAAAGAESARANLEASEAETGVTKASANSAAAGLRNAELQLSYTQVRAPVAGRISRKTVETGQQLQPGQALMAVVPHDVWVIANLKETQLERVHPGQRVDVKIDTLPSKTFYATVDSIQEGTGATFSLLPPDNATGNFTKIVQRVPVKIVFDPESIRDFQDKILPGLSVVPHIDLRGDKREPKRAAREEKQNRKAEETQ